MTDSMRMTRARGALTGLALGDALGMPTQTLSPAEIRQSYGTITGLVDATADQPIAPGMPAGSVTDDTEQALLLADLIVAGHGHLDDREFATALLAWEDDMKARGSLDLLGPSTKAALEHVRAGGDPRLTGKNGTTNGAAMRVTPVGIAHSLADFTRFVDAVYDSCMVTHNTQPGIQSATLVAAAVSAGIDGQTVPEALTTAVRTTRNLPDRGFWSPTASVLARTQVALDDAELFTDDELRTYLTGIVGTSVASQEAIPAAFLIARHYARDPFAGLCCAASIGGDTDTIGAIVGAILGACEGMQAFPADQVAQLTPLPIDSLAQHLLAIRDQPLPPQ